MKKILSMAVTLFISMSAFSQSIKPQQATFEDYIPLLNAAGYKAYSFDISDFLDNTYQVEFEIKEYKDGVELKGENIEFCFSNRRMIKDFPEENQKDILEKGLAVDPEKGVYSHSDKLTVAFSPNKLDSLKNIHLSLTGIGAGSRRLILKGLQSPDSDEIFYHYQDRPFKLGEFKEGTFIPLVLYGSFWLDKKYNIFRFCGEKEIDPDLSTEILQYIPHYYIIGVKFVKKETK